MMPSSKSHPCKTCAYTATSQRMLARHVAIAHSSVVFRCPMCPFVSCYKANFYRHKREIHGLRRSFCELCGFEAASVDELLQHRQTAHPFLDEQNGQEDEDPSLQNEFLEVNSNTSSSKGNKQKVKTDNVVHIESSPEAIDVDVEFDEHLTELVEVDSPEASPKKSKNLLNMELSPLKVRRQYTCTCGLKTINPREFLTHRRDEHGEKMTIYECQHCIYATKNVQKLYRHCGLVHKQLKEHIIISETPPKKTLPVKKIKSKKLNVAATGKRPGIKVKNEPGMSKYPPPPTLKRAPFQRKPALTPSTVSQVNSPAELESFEEEEFAEDKNSVASSETIASKKTTNDKYKCRNCPFSAKSKVLLVRHEKTVHLRKKFFRCQTCDYVCHERGRYTKHVKYHSLPKTKCEFCDFETPYKWNLDRHLKNHELGGEFQCDKCTFTAHNRQSMTMHLANHHANSSNPDTGNSSKAEESPEPEEVLDDVQDDEENHSGPDEESDKEVDEEEMMMAPDNHEDLQESEEEEPEMVAEDWENNNNNNNGEGLEESEDEAEIVEEWENNYSYESEESYRKILRCHFCPFKTIWPQALNRHEAAHKLTKKYPCHLCGMSFDALAWLSRHLAQIHRQPVHPKNLLKMFAPKKKVVLKPTSNRFGMHEKATNARKRQQPIFEEPRQFVNKPKMPSRPPSEKFKERNVIAGRTKLTREQCEMITSHPLVLVRPVEDGKPLNICRVCGYKTRWISEIEKHLRVHSDQKPFSCPCCMYRCKWKGDLKRHVFKYHGQQALSLIKDPEVDPLYQRDADEESSWPKERFKPAVSNSPLRTSTPKGGFNAPKSSQWKRVPPSKRSGTVLKLTKSKDQDSPLDLTTPRHPEYEYSKSDSHNVTYDEEDNDLDDETFTEEGFGGEWSSYALSSGMEEYEPPMNRNFSHQNLKPKELKSVTIPSTRTKSNRISASRQVSALKEMVPIVEKQKASGSGFSAKRYKCTYCPFLSKTASRFHVHIIQHLNKKPFLCSACGYKSNWEWDITKHIKIKGLRDETHAKAEMLVTDESGLKNYEKYNKFLVDIGENFEEISAIGISSPEKVSLPPEEDRMVVMPEMPELLGNSEPSSELLPTDMMETEFSVYDQSASNHPRVFKCKHCDFTNNEKKAVIGHLGVHAGLKPYRCKLCGMMSNWKHVIIRHVKLRHGGEMNFVEDRITYTQEGDIIKLSGVIVEGKPLPIVQKMESSSTVFPCSLCPYTCEKHYYMQFHMKQHQPRPDANMKCPLCPYWVKFKKTLTRHMKLHEMPSYVPYQTPDHETVQAKEIETEQQIQQAEQQKMIEVERPKKRKRHQCDVCPYATNNMTQFLYHKQFHRPNKNAPFKCNMCSYWSTHNHLIIQHTKIHNSINTLVLSENGPLDSAYSVNYDGEFVTANEHKAKKSKLDVVQNEAYLEPEPEYKYSCTMCSYQCNDQRSLSTHYKFHQVVNTELMEPKKPENILFRSRGFSYFCKDCPGMFKSKSDYTTHCSFHGAWLPFSCPHCNYKAKHKPHLHKHLHVHSDDYVARREASSTPLSLGNTCHTTSSEMPSTGGPGLFLEKQSPPSNKLTSRLGVKQLKCSFCPAIFYKQLTFEYHVSLHGGTGEHQCSMCTYAANSASGLTKHLELHHKKISAERKSSVKIFNCMHCPAFFNKQARFDKHVSLHGQENKYTCEHCNYSVKFAANLIKHRAVHNIPQPLQPLPPSPAKEVTIPLLPPPQAIPPIKAPAKGEAKEVKDKIWFSCNRCPYAQSRKDAVQSHQRRHKITKDGMSCPHCDYCTMQTSFLRDHIKRHFQAMPYVKIQAYFKCGPMEIWAVDAEERELIFKYGGEDSDETSRYFPDDVDRVRDAAPNEDKPQSNCIVNEKPDVEDKFEKPPRPAESEVQAEDAVPLAPSCEMDKKKLIEDALRKTKKLEIVLTDVFLQKRSLLKLLVPPEAKPEANFKVPHISLAETPNTGSEQTEVETTDASSSYEVEMPILSEPVSETVEPSKDKEVNDPNKCNDELTGLTEGNVMIDFTTDYFEGVEEYMEHTEVEAEIETTANENEELDWVEKPNEDEPMVVADIMIGGDVYADEPVTVETVTITEDIVSDKESEETITMEEHFLEEVSDGNPSDKEACALPVEVDTL